MTALSTIFALLAQLFLTSTPAFVASDDPRDRENRKELQQDMQGGAGRPRGHCPHG